MVLHFGAVHRNIYEWCAIEIHFSGNHRDVQPCFQLAAKLLRISSIFFPSDEHFWIGIMDSGSIGNLRNGGREPATSIQHASRRKNVRELLTLRYFTAIHATNARLIALNFYYITTSNDWCCWLTRWNWKHRIPRGSWWCCRKIEESHRITFICLLELP